MPLSIRSRGAAAVVGTATLLALLGATLTVPAEAAPQDPPLACPAAVPLSSVKAGMVGQGLTVVSGNEPEPFRVDVLGVIADGIGAGRDLIMIKVSDLPGGHVVDQGGGIWAGMSGSPVYVDGQLLGAVSYGFTLAPSAIGGLTPAADMYDVLQRSGSQVQRQSAVQLSAAARRTLAAKAGTAAPKGSLEPISSPMAVSGVSTSRLQRLQRDTDKAGWNVNVYRAGRATAADVGAPTSRPVPGGNFAAALSFGDVTAGVIGTTTAVCGNRAVAFGHPIDLAGKVGYAATDADTLAIVKDDTLGSYKQVNLTTGFGTVTQDRTAAVGADLTKGPELSTISTIVRNLDTGRRRFGTTDVTTQSLIPGIAPYAVVANEDTTFDEEGDGRAISSWTITGTRGAGHKFVLTRANQFASRYDISSEPAYDLAYTLDALANNDYENLHIDTVSFASKMTTNFQQLHITKLEVSVNGGRYTSASRLAVKAGSKLKLRVSLQPYRSTTTSTRILDITVPKNAKGKVGLLSAIGGVDLSEGSDDSSCLLFGEGCSDESDGGSLVAIAKSIRDAPRNDTIAADLRFSSDGRAKVKQITRVQRQKLTVTGTESVLLVVR